MKIMKKLNYLFIILAIAGLSFLATSCGDTTEAEKPTITITSPTGDTLEYLAGDTIPFTVVLGTNNKELKTLKIELKKKDGALYATSGVDSTLEKGKTNITINIGIILPSLINAGDILEITFTVTDAEPLSASVTKVIKIKAAAANINTYSATLFNIIASASSKSFFASSTGKVYSYTEVNASTSLKAGIDITYYYGNTDTWTLCNLEALPSPWASLAGDMSSWTKNNTTFKITSISTADFDAITNETQLLSKFIETGTDKKATELSTGKVVSFKTASGKKGLLKVTEIKGTSSSGDYIKVDIKIQK